MNADERRCRCRLIVRCRNQIGYIFCWVASVIKIFIFPTLRLRLHLRSSAFICLHLRLKFYLCFPAIKPDITILALALSSPQGTLTSFVIAIVTKRNPYSTNLLNQLTKCKSCVYNYLHKSKTHFQNFLKLLVKADNSV